MRKVILADDEQSSLDLLHKIIDWNSLDLEISGCARDGKEVMKLIHLYTPDILITDIRMPRMDGMDLLERIRIENMKMEIILVSAYSDFEYTQRALSFGVTGYLLKPVEEEKLEKLLTQAIDSLELREKNEKKNSLTKRIAENRILRKMLYSADDADPLKEMLREIGCEFSFDQYRIIAVYLDYFTYKDHTIFSNIHSQKLVSIVKRAFIEAGFKEPVVFDDRIDEWIILLPEQSKLIKTEEKIESILCAIFSIPGVKYYASVSRLCKGSKEMAEGFIMAKNNFRDRQPEQPFLFPDRHDVFYPPQTSMNEPEYFRRENYPVEIKSPVVQKAIEYIEEHFREDLSLDQICNHSAISKTYFCGFFKKEMNESIWDYLTKRRIKEAVVLLKDGKLLNYQIAYEIGYENPGYFSRMFRRIIGISPREYRRKIKNGSSEPKEFPHKASS